MNDYQKARPASSLYRALPILSLCVFVAVLAFVVRAERPVSAAAAPVSVAPVWSASSTDLLAIDGLNAILADVDKQVAPIVTDDRSPGLDDKGNPIPGLRTRLINYVAARMRYFDAGNKRLMEDAASSHRLPPGERVYFRPDLVAWVATSQ